MAGHGEILYFLRVTVSHLLRVCPWPRQSFSVGKVICPP
jgi:hypothetical protein